MPVMHFRIQWPDNSEENCYSPSQVVSDFFTPGEDYPVDDFVLRAREALNIASERVREKYGFACSAAMDQLAQIKKPRVSTLLQGNGRRTGNSSGSTESHGEILFFRQQEMVVHY